MVYLARAKEDKTLVCIKRMLAKNIHENKFYKNVVRELTILHDIQDVEGCIELYDVVTDDDSLSLVMPWYPLGDLYHYINIAKSNKFGVSQRTAQHICKQMVQILKGLH